MSTEKGAAMRLHASLQLRFLNRLVLSTVIFVANRSAFAEPPSSDALEDLRRALTEPEPFRDPDLAKRLAKATKATEQKNILEQARSERVRKALERLNNLAEMRQAILLREWREYGEGDEVAEDRKLRALLSQRFAMEVSKVLKNGDSVRRLAALNMLADMEFNSRMRGAEGWLARTLQPELTGILKQRGDPELCAAAARALGHQFPDPQVAVHALAELLKSDTLLERRAAAEALGNLVQTAAEIVARKQCDDSVVALRSDIISTAMAVLPVAGAGLEDQDQEVRRLCAEVFRQVALALSAQVPNPETASRNQNLNDAPDLASVAETYKKTREELSALVAALAEQTSKLTRHLNEEIEVALAASQALENIAETRLQLRTIRQMHVPASDKQLDDVLCASLRAALPGLEKQLAHKEARVKLAAIYVLETLETEAAPLAPVVADCLKDKDRFVRWGAARCLGKMAPCGAEFAVPALSAIVEDPVGDVRHTALAALKQHGKSATRAVPALARVLERGDNETRLLAAQALGAIGANAEPAVMLLAGALSDSEPMIRSTAAEALGRIGPPARPAQSALQKALSDPEADVRRAASDALLIIK
jgi:HEAT repeat protein